MDEAITLIEPMPGHQILINNDGIAAYRNIETGALVPIGHVNAITRAALQRAYGGVVSVEGHLVVPRLLDSPE